MESNHESFDLVAMLLEEQQSLTAVEEFSAIVDDEKHSESDQQPAQALYYRNLLPASPPGSGEQYAFRVNLTACSGCKACVVACHALNGLDEEESWRRVGTLTIGGDEPRIQHVTSACHHCADPGCLSGCPVVAYEKDPVTGIVRHLDDQCIGCKYCTMMCPYEVPQYSERLGIVRKCDMCQQRLSVGEAPACAQSCPNEAISIDVVSADSLAQQRDRIVPGAPPSEITRPTTTYVDSTRTIFPLNDGAFPREDGTRPEIQSQDAGIDVAGETHWPLALMLVATQISVGMLFVERMATTWSGSILMHPVMPESTTRWLATWALVIAIVGLNLATLHLGQPFRAWRVFLGLRTSWLSREAVVLGQFVGLLTIAVGLLWLPQLQAYIPGIVYESIPLQATEATLWLALGIGIAGLICSAMIYIATKRSVWRAPRTFGRFLGTALVGGSSWTGLVLLSQEATSVAAIVVLVTIVASAAKFAWEYRIPFGPLRQIGDPLDRRSQRLAHGPLRTMSRFRIACQSLGCLLLLFALSALCLERIQVALPVALIGVITLTTGEICERLLYFKSVVYERMPGTLR